MRKPEQLGRNGRFPFFSERDFQRGLLKRFLIRLYFAQYPNDTTSEPVTDVEFRSQHPRNWTSSELEEVLETDIMILIMIVNLNLRHLQLFHEIMSSAYFMDQLHEKI